MTEFDRLKQQKDDIVARETARCACCGQVCRPDLIRVPIEGGHEPPMESITAEQFRDLVQRADAYIFALRTFIRGHNSSLPILTRLKADVIETGSCWVAARESCASHIQEPTG